MKPRRGRVTGGAAGFTLIETLSATVIFSVLGLALMSAVRIADGSRETITNVVQQSEHQRESTGRLMSELKSTSDTLITVVPLPGGNHELTFQLPITVGGAFAWGVGDQPDWQVRYTVQNQAVGGTVERTLVRQVLDAAGVIQETEDVATGLASGVDDPPGFQVTQAGALWEVVLTADQDGTQRGRRTRFHVRTRN